MSLNREGFLKEYAEWVNDPQVRSMRLEEPMKDAYTILTRSSGNLSCDQRISLSTEMCWLGPFYWTQGVVMCCAGQAKGWRLVKRGLLYVHWHHRIAARARDYWEVPIGRSKRHFKLAMSLAEVASLGLAIARPEAIWSLDAMERGLNDGSVGWIYSDYFAAYLLRLYRKLRRQDDIVYVPPDAENGDHPFNGLIDHWEDEVDLAHAIKRMCDYHLRWNYEDTDERDSEFSSPYAMINPIEIHALRAVREELGLSMPRVEHELLQPPLYPVPEFAKSITTEEILQEDELLRQIIERNQPWCDGVEE